MTLFLSDICAVLGYCAAFSGNSLLTFCDNLSVPSSRHKKFLDSWISWPLKMGLIHSPEMSAKNYSYRLCNDPEECRCHLLHGRSLKSRLFLPFRRHCIFVTKMRGLMLCRELVPFFNSLRNLQDTQIVWAKCRVCER